MQRGPAFALYAFVCLTVAFFVSGADAMEGMAVVFGIAAVAGVVLAIYLAYQFFDSVKDLTVRWTLRRGRP